MIELKIAIDEVDYANVLEKAMPEILPKLAKNKGEMVQKILQSLNGKPGELAIKALKYLPRSIQDEIAVNLLSNYKTKIIDALHKLAEEQNISITISDISVELKS